MYRYFREKVLPSSKMSSGEAVDKVTIVNTLKQMRDAPTEDIYDDLKEELFEIMDRLLVKPGNTKPFGTFHYYFDKNWHSCRPMWVFCHRKTFPTMGVREVAESTFRALKHYEKLEFGRTSPRLEGMIPIIMKVLKNRHKERLQWITNKRLVIHHDNAEYKYALDQASYVLYNGARRSRNRFTEEVFGMFCKFLINFEVCKSARN